MAREDKDSTRPQRNRKLFRRPIPEPARWVCIDIRRTADKLERECAEAQQGRRVMYSDVALEAAHLRLNLGGPFDGRASGTVTGVLDRISNEEGGRIETQAVLSKDAVLNGVEHGGPDVVADGIA